MGGDHAPAATVGGALEALAQFGDITLILVGREDALRPHLKGAYDPARLLIEHTEQVVGMDDHAAESLRQKQSSSIARSAELVREGRAQAMVAAGNLLDGVAGLPVLHPREVPQVEVHAVGASPSAHLGALDDSELGSLRSEGERRGRGQGQGAPTRQPGLTSLGRLMPSLHALFSLGIPPGVGRGREAQGAGEGRGGHGRGSGKAHGGLQGRGRCAPRDGVAQGGSARRSGP